MKIDEKDNEEQLHKLCFSQFDLASVLQHGKLLLGSAGKEYDIDFSDMTPQERLELQRRNLKERLGLGSQFMDGNSKCKTKKKEWDDITFWFLF